MKIRAIFVLPPASVSSFNYCCKSTFLLTGERFMMRAFF
jgi:hypothetical protein